MELDNKNKLDKQHGIEKYEVQADYFVNDDHESDSNVDNIKNQ